MPTMTDTQ